MNTPAIPPPARKSDPPQVKLERSRLDAAVDIVCAAFLTYLIACGKLQGPYERGAALTGILAIAGVAAALRRKGQPGGLVLPLLVTAPKAIAYAGAWLIRHNGGPFIALSLGVACSSCAGMDLPDPATARIALNKQAEAMNRLGPVLSAACAPEPAPAWCVDALTAFDDAGKAHRLAQDFVDTYAAVSQ